MDGFDNKTLRARVHQHLRDGLLSGRIPPGTVLQEVPLAGSLGVSRGPVREALGDLAAEGLVTLDELRLLTPFICAGGDVFRAQIVGYFHGGGPSYRSEVIFDATGAAPRVLFWRDISHLGRGYALETLGVDLTVAAQP